MSDPKKPEAAPPATPATPPKPQQIVLNPTPPVISAATNDLPPLLKKFFNIFLLSMSRTKVEPLLKEPDLLEDRVRLLAGVFEKNIHWIQPFGYLIKSLHSFETMPALDEQVRFFTAKHTRNWLICNMVNDVLQIKELKLDLVTGRLPQRPHDLFGMSYQAMSALGEESRYKDLLFTCGFIFDFLLFASKNTHYNPEGLKIDDTIKQSFAKGLEEARRIVHLSKYKDKLSLEKFAPIVAMLRQAALVTMMFLDKTCIDFQKKADTAKMPETLRCAIERKLYGGVHTGMIMSFYASTFSVFENLAEIVAPWPYIYTNWRSGTRDLHDAAGMAALGIAVCGKMQASQFPEGQQVSLGLPELEYLNYISKHSVLGGR